MFENYRWFSCLIHRDMLIEWKLLGIRIGLLIHRVSHTVSYIYMHEYDLQLGNSQWKSQPPCN